MRALTSGLFTFVSFASVACSGDERSTASTDLGSARHSVPEISADRIEARADTVFRAVSYTHLTLPTILRV